MQVNQCPPSPPTSDVVVVACLPARMAKSLRSKVKKRLRTVKRGVIKRELSKPETKVGLREAAKEKKLAEALSGHILPGA